jgi:hypothetical protein
MPALAHTKHRLALLLAEHGLGLRHASPTTAISIAWRSRLAFQAPGRRRRLAAVAWWQLQGQCRCGPPY